MITAAIFDLDGVLIESEELWDEVRREIAGRHHGRWRPESTRAMQGMNTSEWAGYLHDTVGVTLPEGDIIDQVVGELLARYRQHLPLLPGAVNAVRRAGSRWQLGVASSSPRQVIEAVLQISGLVDGFQSVVSSDEVAAGKPAPDVYLESARRLQIPPRACAAIEDSANGIRAAKAAGMIVLAVPNRRYPPPSDVLALADRVLASLDGIKPELLGVGLGAVDPQPHRESEQGSWEERLDEEEIESFPASDPHSDWAGPPGTD